MGSGLISSTDNKANLVKSCFLLKKRRGWEDPTTAHLSDSVRDTQFGLFSSHRSMTLSIKLFIGTCTAMVVTISFSEVSLEQDSGKKTDALEEGFKLLSLWA